MKKFTIILCAIIFVAFGLFIVSKSYVTNMDFSVFNYELWDKYPKIRYQMISDFEQKHPLNSLTKSSVKDLLGEEALSETATIPLLLVGLLRKTRLGTD